MAATFVPRRRPRVRDSEFRGRGTPRLISFCSRGDPPSFPEIQNLSPAATAGGGVGGPRWNVRIPPCASFRSFPTQPRSSSLSARAISWSVSRTNVTFRPRLVHARFSRAAPLRRGCRLLRWMLRFRHSSLRAAPCTRWTIGGWRSCGRTFSSPRSSVRFALCPLAQVGEAIELLRPHAPCPDVMSLDPTRLEDVLADILHVGERVGRADEAERLVDGLRGRLEALESASRGRPRPSVVALEWLDPPFLGGHWVPQMIVLAGGRDPFSVAPGSARGARAGRRSRRPTRTGWWRCPVDSMPRVRSGSSRR